MRAIGLMSGTSMDGIDIALMETDGKNKIKPLGFLSSAYSGKQRGEIEHACRLAREADMDKAQRLEESLTQWHIEAVEDFLQKHKLSNTEIDVIGFHGVTILHEPKYKRSWQLGNGEIMAQALGIDTVCNFRNADMQAGGQGAPLAALFHEALAYSENMALPVLFVNIGGISNVSYVSAEGVWAFDAGAGNALLDEWAEKHLGTPLDKGGKLAAKGKPDEALLSDWLAHPYFSTLPPKSLDRGELAQMVKGLETLSPEDGAASLVAFTAEAIGQAAKSFSPYPLRAMVCGGGRHNKTLMKELASRLGCEVFSSDIGDEMEALCFAWLGVR
ncbi:MAG: anhydro-N-acetylmuramic acid kinase, partial [Parvibaculales bacterium]